MKPLVMIDSRETKEGTLALMRRGERDFLITIAGRVLMTSTSNRSERVLGLLACRPIAGRSSARVLIGGLGMGFTLRTALDELPKDAQVTVAELNPVTEDWCRGPLAPLITDAMSDPRVKVEIIDVALAITHARTPFDAILIDLYVGPDSHTKDEDPLYGNRATKRALKALTPGGVYAVWGEAHDATFEKRLSKIGFQTRYERPGKGGLKHVVYVGTKPAADSA